MKRNVIIRRFECPECGYEAIAPKKMSRATPVGHIKTMYCPSCKKEQQFVQLPEYDT